MACADEAPSTQRRSLSALLNSVLELGGGHLASPKSSESACSALADNGFVRILELEHGEFESLDPNEQMSVEVRSVVGKLVKLATVRAMQKQAGKVPRKTCAASIASQFRDTHDA